MKIILENSQSFHVKLFFCIFNSFYGNSSDIPGSLLKGSKPFLNDFLFLKASNGASSAS